MQFKEPSSPGGESYKSLPVLIALTQTSPIAKTRDEITSKEGFESRVIFVDDVVQQMELIRFGKDYHGYDTNVNVKIKRDGTKMQLTLTIDGKTIFSKELDGTDVLEEIGKKKAYQTFDKLKSKLGVDKMGPYSWVAESFVKGESLEAACKGAAVVALTYACKAGTLATGNPVVAGAGQLGCAYLSGWVVEQAWPQVEKAADWLADNVPGLKQTWQVAKDVWSTGQKVWTSVTGGLSDVGKGFADLIGF